MKIGFSTFYTKINKDVDHFEDYLKHLTYITYLVKKNYLNDVFFTPNKQLTSIKYHRIFIKLLKIFAIIINIISISSNNFLMAYKLLHPFY